MHYNIEFHGGGVVIAWNGWIWVLPEGLPGVGSCGGLGRRGAGGYIGSGRPVALSHVGPVKCFQEWWLGRE